MTQPLGVPTKKPYQKPVVSVYGDIRDITQSAGPNGKGDGGGGGATMNMTSL
jgi:hypothetical protein